MSCSSGIIILAFGMDLLLGDPRWLPHPVRWIGKLARFLERESKPVVRPFGKAGEFIAGTLSALLIYLLSFLLPWVTVTLLGRVHPILHGLGSMVIIYTTIALRSLLGHSLAVHRPLRELSLREARSRVAMLVGRDTQNLSRREIVRACVESVAENMVDGVTAPLFYAVFLGAPGAMLYRAINTLDSIYGHRDERYEWFGKFAARVDDLANFIPARLSALLVGLAAMLLGTNPLGSFRMLIRDGRKHPSPNSGLSEAAVAGALDVRLGGMNYYDGIASRKPFLGEATNRLQANTIRQANHLVLVTSVLSGALFLTLRYCFVR